MFTVYFRHIENVNYRGVWQPFDFRDPIFKASTFEEGKELLKKEALKRFGTNVVETTFEMWTCKVDDGNGLYAIRPKEWKYNWKLLFIDDDDRMVH